MKINKIDKYTSTGIKFWRHPEAMNSYLKNTGKTIISTHISPEGRCNLKCSYCSVTKRKKHNRIKYKVIQDYILKLKSRGLKAVILTGGGEPTLYPFFNNLINFLKNENLHIGLITNGTRTNYYNNKFWNLFDWIRISINNISNWETKIIPPNCSNSTIIGASLVYTGQELNYFKKINSFAKKYKLTYIRVLPNCMLEQKTLLKTHEKLKKILKKLNNKIFFHQFKLHNTPKANICHQSYFRPYLSEVNGGTVFPCDSLVLNNKIEYFANKYKICKAKNILNFMDKKIKLNFNIQKLCTGCVFTDNINMLNDWKKNKINYFDKYNKKILHEEFI